MLDQIQPDDSTKDDVVWSWDEAPSAHPEPLDKRTANVFDAAFGVFYNTENDN